MVISIVYYTFCYGGRISKTVAFAGKILTIKPVVGVKNGKVELIGKARGSKNGNNLLRDTFDLWHLFSNLKIYLE